MVEWLITGRYPTSAINTTTNVGLSLWSAWVSFSTASDTTIFHSVGRLDFHFSSIIYHLLLIIYQFLFVIVTINQDIQFADCPLGWWIEGSDCLHHGYILWRAIQVFPAPQSTHAIVVIIIFGHYSGIWIGVTYRVFFLTGPTLNLLSVGR